MEREIGNVSALASELLTLARLDSAAAIVEFTAFDLAVLVREIVADAVYEAPTREFDLRVETPNRAAFVMGNADLLRRAIENVVRNALFYTAARTPIDIILSVHHDRLAAIEVRDEGPGVPESALLHLFEPFYRVDEARARKTGGSGIGLAICQRVASLHGGTVHARANAPQGLIVEIEIPLDQRQR
jgi:signal transduction histidine kinase